MPDESENLYTAVEGINALDELVETCAPKPALERLGPSPFPKSGFPLLGFLATLYEQVADSVNGHAATK